LKIVERDKKEDAFPTKVGHPLSVFVKTQWLRFCYFILTEIGKYTS
jgi:hypothetical protein